MPSKKHNYITDIILIALGLLCLAPLVYMVVTSLNNSYSSYAISFDPRNFTLEHYISVLTNKKMVRALFNSIVYSGGAVILTLVYSCLAGYAFAKMNFKGANVIFFLMIMTLMIPMEVTLVPRYLIIKELHWLNSFKALILTAPGVFGVFLMRQAMLSIPKELIESARMDGCGDLRILWSIVLPLVRSAMLMLVIFTFLVTWNGFLWPLIVSTKQEMYTLPLAIATLKENNDVNVGADMAKACLSFLPPFLLYLVLQKRFVEGVSMTGMKG